MNSRTQALFLLIVAGGCMKQSAGATTTPTHAVAAVEEHEAFEEESTPTCKGRGPLSCDIAPSSGDELCTQLAKCLAARDPSKAKLTLSGCGELSSFETAPEGSGVQRVGVVNVDGELDGKGGQGSYLVAEGEGGFCLIDQAVRWQSTTDGYLDTDSRLEWREVGGKTRLSIHTQSIFFAENEEEDDGEGASVKGAMCREAEYAIEAGRLVALRERAVSDTCSDE